MRAQVSLQACRCPYPAALGRGPRGAGAGWPPALRGTHGRLPHSEVLQATQDLHGCREVPLLVARLRNQQKFGQQSHLQLKQTGSGVFAPRPPAATAARRLSGPGRGREDQAAGLSCVWGRGTGQQGGRPREQKGRRPVNAQMWADLRARSGTGGGGEGSPHWRGTAAEPQRAAPRPPGRRPCRTRSQRPGGPRVPALPLARRASGERAPRGRSVPWTALGCHTVPETAARF